MSTLITNMKVFRTAFALSQEELANKVGVRRETIIHLERGQYNPSLKLAMDIAKVFGKTVEEVFRFADE
ncbi:MAG: helix-turn-helix transcriptional regulator [Hungatella sp.]